MQLNPQASEVLHQIIAEIRAGADEWMMPWHHKGEGFPVNAFSGQRYRGTNVLVLWHAQRLHSYESHRWATLRQWNMRRSRVRIGAKGTRILVPIFSRKRNPTGEPNLIGWRTTTVFNGDQVRDNPEGHPDLFGFVEERPSVEALVRATAAQVKHGASGAWYIPASDLIEMPNKESFVATRHGSATDGYYSTLLHELVHWSGARTRLARPIGTQDREEYAKEELIAELGAAFLCAHFSRSVEPRPDHAAYLSSWLKHLDSDEHYLLAAASAAQKAFDFLLKFTGGDGHSSSESGAETTL